MSPERSGSHSSPQEQALVPREMHASDEGGPIREAESPIALLLAVAQGGRGADDDLTSLSWLQDRNLLKHINLSKADTDELSPTNSTTNGSSSSYRKIYPHILSDQSPTSDYVDDSSVSAAESSNSSLNSPIPHQHHNYTPRTRHPHNQPYDPLVHTTSKPPYSFSCLIFMAIEDSEKKALPVKDIYAWIVDHFPYFKNAPTGWKNSVRHNLSLNKCFQKVEKAPNLGKGSLWMVDQQYRPNLLQALTRSPFHPCSTLDPTIYFSSSAKSNTNGSANINNNNNNLDPKSAKLNPELFPYLSRHLAGTEAKTAEDSDESLDAVDAAAVMLSLKHGPKLFRKTRSGKVGRNPWQVITNSPSEDHTYSAAKNQGNRSPDEAFESEEESPINYTCRKIDFANYDEEREERRRIEEGADALLNLAGVTTHRKRYSSQSFDNSDYHHQAFLATSTPAVKRPRKAQKPYSSHPEPAAPAVEPDRPSQFRPRLLRSKRKNDPHKRKLTNNNHGEDAVVPGAETSQNHHIREGGDGTTWSTYQKAISNDIKQER